MIEIYGNLWDYCNNDHVICITTNGFVKANGHGVMGRGCALEATKKFPGITKTLGTCIKKHGNIPSWLSYDPPIISFPTKHNWWETSNMQLIEEGLWMIKGIMTLDARPFVMPRPGCGNGKLKWEDVKPLFDHSSDKIWVISPKK
jgi:hypothetical protein